MIRGQIDGGRDRGLYPIQEPICLLHVNFPPTGSFECFLHVQRGYLSMMPEA